MLEWIRSNTEILSLAVNLCMLAVWGIYLQFFLSSLRRQARSNILINLGPQDSVLVSNMSTESVYIQKIMLVDSKGKGHSITDLAHTQGLKTHQGPLGSAASYELGKLSELQKAAELKETSFELKLIATYTSEDLPVAASRCFEWDQESKRWKASGLQTSQIRSKKERLHLVNELQT